MIEPHGRTGGRVSPLFVGRDDALALALRRWTAAREGAGHLLLVAGEAGIGKTRLLREIQTRADPVTRVVKAGAFPRDAEAPGGVVLSISEGMRRADLATPAKELRDRLLETDYDGDSARRRRLLVADLADILAAALGAEPTLLQIEDLHWADDLSLQVIEQVAPMLADLPAMVVATYRTDELYPGTPLGLWRARLLERRAAEELRLPRLDIVGTAEMVEAITGEVPSTEFVLALQARSDGIPLHIEELVAGASDSAVPDTVAESVVTRAASLDPGVRSVLDAASVVGRSFDIDLLAAVVDIVPEEMDAALQSLVERRLLATVDSEGTFVFRHALICDAVYATIPPLRKRALHAAFARVAEDSGFGEAFVSEHYERANDPAHAYRSSLAGAVEAVRVSAHREAAGLFRRAQRAAPRDIAPAENAALHADLARELAAIDDNDGAAENLAAAIEIYRAKGDERSAAGLVPRLVAARHLLGARLEERVSLAREALDRLEGMDPSPVALRAGLLGSLAASYMLDRRLDDSLAVGRAAAALLDDESDASARTGIEVTLGTVLVFAGAADEGWALLEAAIERSSAANLEAETARGYRMIGSSASVLLDYGRASRWIGEGLAYTARTEQWSDHYYLTAHLAHVRWAQGDTSAAEPLARRALADGRGITSRITALIVLGYLALVRGDGEAARGPLTEAFALGESMAELQRLSPALWGLAELALGEGDTELAVALCERGFDESNRVKDAAYLFPFVMTGTRAHLARRDTGLAREWLARCSTLLRLRDLPGTLAALEHAGGLIELAEGRTGSARALLERAAQSWRDSDRWWEGTQVLVDLARCAVRSRRPSEAHRLLGEVRERAARAGSALVEALADEVHLARDLDAGPLSARELEVARLVASGATNREIAERLVISPKTASTHIEHILAKLGASRRAEIAAWVAKAVP